MGATIILGSILALTSTAVSAEIGIYTRMGEARTIEQGNGTTKMMFRFQASGPRITTNSQGSAVFGTGTVGGRTGYPALPMQKLKFLLPPDAVISSTVIELQNANTRRLKGTHQVDPVLPYVGENGPEWPKGREFRDWRDVAVYTSDEFYPDSHLQLSSHALLRHWKLAWTYVFPYRYNPGTGQLEFMRSFMLVLSFRRDENELKKVPSSKHRLSIPVCALRQRRRQNLLESTENFIDVLKYYQDASDRKSSVENNGGDQ